MAEGKEYYGPTQPITSNGDYKAKYTNHLNPHLHMTRISPKGEAGVWKCEACGVFGPLESITHTGCPVPCEPCNCCGLTPICAEDCPGVSFALGVTTPEGEA